LSLLYSSGNIKEFNGIFDTQIAHRMCYEDEYNCISNGTKNNSISLNELLKINFGINVTIKDEIHDLMSKSPYLWKTRPIPYKLNYYAGCDVYYLPKLYDLFCQKIESKIVKNISIQDIFKECEKYMNYLTMNKNIKNYNKMNLTEGTEIKGLIKNFQNHCVYIQLNIGYIGIIDVFPSVQILKEKYKLGDIVDFTIIKIDNKKKRMMLDLVENKDEINDINLDINHKEEIKLTSNDTTNNYSSNLIHGLNINKESFFPKSYNRNGQNNNNTTTNYINYNDYENNAFNNNYQYNNKNQDNNYYYNNNENYYKENEGKKDYNNYNNNKNYLMNNEAIFNNNYNGLFYDYEGKYYYYNNSDDPNNNDNEDENANSYYYTLKPFPK
jgi:hypothetical protein